MNKTELINAVSEKTGVTKKDVDAIIKATTDTIVASVKKGDPVALVGFGTFSRVKRAARTMKNPQTGAPLKIKATNVPKFKAGKAFKEAVAKSK